MGYIRPLSDAWIIAVMMYTDDSFYVNHGNIHCLPSILLSGWALGQIHGDVDKGQIQQCFELFTFSSLLFDMQGPKIMSKT